MLQQIKLEQIESKIQVVIFDVEGKVQQTCDTLLKIKKETSLYNQFVFFQSLQPIIQSSAVGESHSFPEIEWNEQVNSLFGITITKIDDDQIQMVIVDKTEDYEKLVSNQQSRNDSAINEEVALLQKKVSEMESQLLAFENEELKRIQGFKNEFFASVSHEMRTPLQSITGLVQLSFDNSAVVGEYLPAIKSTSEHLNSIVNDILDLSKIEAGKLTFENLDFDLTETIQSVLIGFQFAAKHKNTELIIEAPKESISVKSDPTRFRQILYNLLGNSLKFTDKGRVQLNIVLVAKEEGRIRIKFELSDTGIGMSAEQIKAVLEPYGQANSTTARMYGGTGLGMGIAIKLIEAFGGKLKIDSTPNKGTNMSFELALNLGDGLSTTSAEQKSIHSIEGLSVLYAEDDEVSRKVIANFLESKKVDLTVVESGDELLSELNNKNFDLVISDLQLSGLSGGEAFLEAAQKGIFTPFIFVSGSRPNIETDIFHSHYTWLQKPVDLTDLQAALAQMEQRKNEFKVNLDLLKRTVGGDQQFMTEMVDTILSTLPKEMALLEKGIENSDWEAVRKITHKIRPSVDYLGIEVLSNLRKEIHALAESNNEETSIEALSATFSSSVACALHHLVQRNA